MKKIIILLFILSNAVMFLFLKAFLLSLIVTSLVFGIIILICIGFSIRTKDHHYFEVNMQNKDPEKGMKWYEDHIKSHLKIMRYTIVSQNGSKVIYKPAFGYDMYEPFVEVDYDLYCISIKGSPLIKRILADLLEINFS